MRLRLVIPAALAAVGTFHGDVLTDRMPPRDAPAPRPAPATARPAAQPAAPQPAAEPSPYFDLAPSPAPDPTKPSVYDLLAGDPPPPAPASAPIAPPSVDAHSEPEAARVAQPDVPRPDQVVETESEPELEATPVTHADVAPPAPVEDTPVPVGDEPRLRVVEESVGDTSSPAGPGPVLDEGRFALGGWAAAAGHSMVSAVTFHSRLSDDIAADRIVLEIEASDNVPDGGLVVLNDPGFAPDRDGFTLLLAAAEPGPFSAAGSYRVFAS